jgi:hypothetical protein
MSARRGLVRAATAVALAAVAGCDDGVAAPDSTDRDAAVYEAVLREVALPATGAAADEVPTIFVAAAGPDAISAQVQADVAKAMVDEADLVFTDDVDDAFTDDEPDRPVRDDALLVTLGPVEGTGPTVEVPAALSHSEQDTSTMTVTVTEQPDGATWWVTAVTPVS